MSKRNFASDHPVIDWVPGCILDYKTVFNILRWSVSHINAGCLRTKSTALIPLLGEKSLSKKKELVIANVLTLSNFRTNFL